MDSMSVQIQGLISILVVPTMQYLKGKFPKIFDVNGAVTLFATAALTGVATYFGHDLTGHPLTPEQLQQYTTGSSLISVFLHQVLKTPPPSVEPPAPPTT